MPRTFETEREGRVLTVRFDNPPNTKVGISGMPSWSAGLGAEPNKASQSRASASVCADEIPWRIAALTRMRAAVRSGYAEYQNRVGCCWRRAQRTRRSRSVAAPLEKSDSLRGKPTQLLQMAVTPLGESAMKSPTYDCHVPE